MNRKPQIKMQPRLAVPLILLALSAGLSQGQPPPTENFYLTARQFDRTMPGGEVVPMWGFAQYESDFTTLIREPNIPGPMLTVPHRNSTLVIHLKNELTVPISLVIPGLPAAMDPNFFTDDQGRRRVRSFTYETHPGQTRQYTWDNLRAGAFMYHSGTHPQVQVQMGLYGGLQVYRNPTNVYMGAGMPNIVGLYFSEIDPNLHNAVADGDYGPGKSMTSTIEFEPKYFLINGQAYYAGMPPIYAGAGGEGLLLRFFNAGLESHFPILQRLYMNVFAEDGNLYPPQPFVAQPPYPKYQYSLLLAAGQTKDAWIEDVPAGLYTIYDRALNLTNNANSPGGMRVQLQVGPGTPNIAPVISSVTATPDIIPPAACTTQLSVVALDPDDSPETPLVYCWMAQGGVGSFDDPTITDPIYTFPGSLAPGTFTFTVHVSDGADTTTGAVDVTIPGPPAPPAPELIIDNRDAGASSAGTWPVSGGANPWGTDSVYSDTRDDTFTFQVARNGENNVYMRWTPFGSRYNAVPVEIFDGATSLGGFTVDQTANAGTWVLLPGGPYTFTGTARVVITVDHGASRSTNADAVRFTPTDAGGPVYVDHIEIVGPTTVGDMDAQVNYDIRVVNGDGSSSITDPQIWDVVDTGASIDAAGALTVPDVTADLPATITAEYTAGGCTYTDTLDITITDGYTATEVIIDNLDAGATPTGTWPVSGGANPYATNSVYSKTNGDTFSFRTDLAGAPYAVYMRWTGWPSRRTSVPVDISTGGSPVGAVTVNQRQNPSMWNLLGIYTLGPNTEVTVTSLDSGGSTNADAVKFTPVSMLTEIIVDNGDPGASATGTWGVSGGANPVGSDSLWSKTVGATYNYHIDATGTFDVYASWTSWPSRFNAVPYEINDGVSPEGTFPMNQQLDGGSWNLVAPGVVFGNSVDITIHSTTAAFSTNADAIRLVPAP